MAPLPERFDDPEDGTGGPASYSADASRAAAETVEQVRMAVLPRWAREAEDRGWWAPLVGADASDEGRRWRSAEVGLGGAPVIVDRVDAASLDGWTLLPRVIAPLDPAVAHAILVAALREGPAVRLSAALDGTHVVAVALSAPSRSDPAGRELLALGVAPAARRAGLGTRLLAAHLASLERTGGPLAAVVSVGDRDPVDPLGIDVRRRVATRLLSGAGLVAVHAPAPLLRVDRAALAFATSI
jgi:GNAT superfamily N-acetyltransferase